MSNSKNRTSQDQAGIVPKPSTDAPTAAPEPLPNDQAKSLADKFDPKRLVGSPAFKIGETKRGPLTSIPVRRPSDEWFIRVHPEIREDRSRTP
jgi:hypothetical protein